MNQKKNDDYIRKATKKKHQKNVLCMSDCLYSILLSFFSAFFFVLFRFQDPRHDLFFFLLSFGQQIKRKWKQEKWNTMKSEQRRKNERNEFLFYERLIMIKILIYFLKCEFEQNNDDDYYLNEFFFSLFSALMINITLQQLKIENFFLNIQIRCFHVFMIRNDLLFGSRMFRVQKIWKWRKISNRFVLVLITCFFPVVQKSEKQTQKKSIDVNKMQCNEWMMFTFLFSNFFFKKNKKKTFH